MECSPIRRLLQRGSAAQVLNLSTEFHLNFVEISEKLGLDWHAIAYIEKDPPIQVESAPPSDTPPEAEPDKKDLGIGWRQVCRDMLEAQNLGRHAIA
jgi:hypothetical protein